MPPKINPAKLNPLQLKTLTLLQAIAQLPDASKPTPQGDTEITAFPHAHGDHFHLGDAVVARQDATGLSNPAVWTALERKGLIRSHFPEAAVLSPAGLAYDTGLGETILHRHHGH